MPFKDTVAQAVETQSAQVYLISNFNQCKRKAGKDIGIGFPKAAILVDYEELQSTKTKEYLEKSVNILGSDGLWASSAVRFFAIYDLMVKLQWARMVCSMFRTRVGLYNLFSCFICRDIYITLPLHTHTHTRIHTRIHTRKHTLSVSSAF